MDEGTSFGVWGKVTCRRIFETFDDRLVISYLTTLEQLTVLPLPL